jgi:DNA polymerase-3 subunit beta
VDSGSGFWLVFLSKSERIPMTTATKERKKSKSGTMTVSAADLRAALAAVSPAVQARGPKPVLANVLVNDGRMTATDLEMRIVAPLSGATGGPVLLPHARLEQIVRSLVGADEVTLVVDGTTCVVEAGNGRWRLPVEDAAEFPAHDEKPAKPIARMPADQFVSLMQLVRPATDNDSSRYALGGVLVEFKGGVLSFVATDGRRMAVSSCEIDQACDNSETLVPRAAVDTVIRLASQQGVDAVQLETTGTELVATIDDAVVFARLVEGRFPKWRDVEPTHDVAPTSVTKAALLHAVRQAAVCTSETSKGVQFAFGATGITLSGRSAEHGESYAICDVVEAGHACKVSLDPRYLQDWLGCRAIDEAETITVHAKDAGSAVVLSNGDVRCVIMPLAAD